MTQKRRPKVIILENDTRIAAHACSILEKEGWEVFCETVSATALSTLSQSTTNLFALFISNFKLPKMEGDDVLLKVKSISPFTQRMLMVPHDRLTTLVSAINKAEIHACIVSPFKDQDLVDQAKNCFKAFKHTLKREQLKRITHHQNKQMFIIAKKLKKKSRAYQKRIDERTAYKRILTAKQQRLETHLSDTKADITLDVFLHRIGASSTPEGFYDAFMTLTDVLETLFTTFSSKYDSTQPIQPDFNQLLTRNTDSTIDPALVNQILKTALAAATAPSLKQTLSSPARNPDPVAEYDHELEEFFDVIISEDYLQAWIKRKNTPEKKCPSCTANDILDLLLQKQISYGILDDDAIDIWLLKSNADEITIAQGECPQPGKDGSIVYHFSTDFTNPGKIDEDGSIDFRERGDIPFVTEGTLLAEKTLPVPGKPGISISGIAITVDEALDPVFTAGAGTTLSDDGTRIHAAIDGQPHCDALGTICVSPELVISGDVDYETGNIDFKGNILIKGMIKEGFSVKGVNLTVQEIEGGNIDVSGDVNVSAGITDSTISAQGHIRAKFINNCQIMGFGDLTVSKEIIDSTVTISGACLNSGGHIISSRISARQGVEAGNVGTSSSTPVKLSVGVNDHIMAVDQQISDALTLASDRANLLKGEVQKLEGQDQTLYEQVSIKAHIQDRSQIEIKAIEAADEPLSSQQKATIKQLKGKAAAAEKELNAIFKQQDEIAGRIETLKTRIRLQEESIERFAMQQAALREFAQKTAPRAVVSVAKQITQDTFIKATHTSKTLFENQSRCKIMELASENNGMMVHQIQITDL